MPVCAMVIRIRMRFRAIFQLSSRNSIAIEFLRNSQDANDIPIYSSVALVSSLLCFIYTVGYNTCTIGRIPFSLTTS